MTNYCDVHGAVEVPEDVTTCQTWLSLNPATGGQCGTVLKATPEELARRAGMPTAFGMAPEAPAPPESYTGRPAAESQPNSTVHARDEDGKRMRQGAFLSAYGKTGRISRAAEIAEIDRGSHYEWLKTDPAYSRQFDQAKRLAFQSLADEAWRRAMGEDGTQASDRLMIKLLESLGPATGNPEYGPAIKHEHSTAPGRPMELNVSATELLHSRVASLVTGAPADKAS
jgi:hypothetical protein